MTSIDEVCPGAIRNSMKSFSMLQVRKMYKAVKAQRSAAGLPQRKIQPVSLWILDAKIDDYFEKHADGYRLDFISVEKRKL